jgi:CDI immunity proteins
MADKTLDELEGEVWGEPEWHSGLVIRCHQLRTKPVDEFSIGDLQIMIGQKIGLPHLMPRAIEALKRDPLAEGDYYPGDLLNSVIGATEFLKQHLAWYDEVAVAAQRALAELDEDNEHIRPHLLYFIATYADSKAV